MQSEIDKLEHSLEYAESKRALGDKMLRLSENKDFHTLIIDGYFRDEAARLTSLLGDPEYSNAQNDIQSDLNSIAAFRRYIRKIIREADMATKEIIDHKEALDDIRANQE